MNEQPETIVVSRHPALVEYLIEIRLAAPATPVITHATAADVRGRHVIGVVPLHLAAEAISVTEIPMFVPQTLRGVELTLEQVRQFAGTPVTYAVCRTDKATR
jgi:hypothetical protein